MEPTITIFSLSFVFILKANLSVDLKASVL